MTALRDLVDAHKANVSSEDAVLATTYDPRANFEPWNRITDLQESRPTTPVNTGSSDLIRALNQLSVSPKKPKTKKRKTTKSTPSVVAPKFQLPVQRFFPSSTSSSKRKHTDIDEDVAASSHSDDNEAIESTATVVHGRPRLDILDRLTVELPSTGKTRIHRCAGKGCPKRFKPRSKVRVLMHCKNCVLMTRDQRKLAAAASANTAPGALVAKHIMKHPTSSESSSLSTSSTSQSLVPTVPAPIDRHAFFGKAGVKGLHSALDLAVVKFVCIARMPPNIVDLICWKDIFALQTPSYSPASRTTLTEDHIQAEQAHVKERQIEFLKTQYNISISFDGGAIKSGASVYTIHATTPGNHVVFLAGHDVTGVSHTGEMIANLVEEEIDTFGKERVGSVSSDNTGNTRNARERLSARLPTALNLQDPNHHINNTWKDIANLEYFSQVVKQIRGIIKYFKQSGHAKNLLKQQREQNNLGPGLESIGKTRFATLVWSAVSVKRCLPGIRTLCEAGSIEIKKWNYLFNRSNPSASLQFEMHLTQFVAIGTPFARAIECLEATSSTPGEVYMFWLAILGGAREALEACFLPDRVCGQIRGIVNGRWQEFFVEGPTNAHLTTFYLNPAYVRSPIFKKPNPLSFSIVLPSKEPPKVPPGIKHPKTFLECAEYLFHILKAEVEFGLDPFLTTFKDKGALFSAQFQQQFSAYAQGNYPFNAPLGLGQTVQAWWQVFVGTENGGILAAGALKLYSAVPHSMADERTMSVITMLNTAQRNRQTVATVVAHAQVRSFYIQKEKKVRRSSRPNPVVRFFDIDRVLRTIDEESLAKSQANYDESDDEEDVILRDKDEGPTAAPRHFDSSPSLPFDDHDEINIMADEVREVLSDGPIVRNTGPTPEKKQEEGKRKEKEQTGGVFELKSWVTLA